MDVRSLGIVDDDTMLRCATRCYDELQCYDEHAELQCYDVLDDAKMSYPTLHGKGEGGAYNP